MQPSPPNGPADPDYKKEYSLRRLEKMQFPTKDEEFKRRLLKGGGKLVDPPVKAVDLSGREKDRSKEKKERREREKEKEKKDRRARDKYRDREKEKQREMERVKLLTMSKEREKRKMCVLYPDSESTDSD